MPTCIRHDSSSRSLAPSRAVRTRDKRISGIVSMRRYTPLFTSSFTARDSHHILCWQWIAMHAPEARQPVPQPRHGEENASVHDKYVEFGSEQIIFVFKSVVYATQLRTYTQCTVLHLREHARLSLHSFCLGWALVANHLYCSLGVWRTIVHMIEVVLNDRLGKKIRVKCKCDLHASMYILSTLQFLWGLRYEIIQRRSNSVASIRSTRKHRP